MNLSKQRKKGGYSGLSRRRFLGHSITFLTGAGILKNTTQARFHAQPKSSPIKINEYRTLGRTGFKVSDIGLGSGSLRDPALLEAILDAGINYIDTAEGYGRGNSEKTIGKVLKNRDRKSLFITTKLGLSSGVTKESIIKRTNNCLERLQTEYVDCMMIHRAETVEMMKNQSFHDAMRQLKAEGKVRFLGLSNHGSQWNEVPETMEKVLLTAAEDGRFDVMLLVYNFIQRDMGNNILKACKEKNIGAAVMKTNPVSRYMRLKSRLDQMTDAGNDISENYINLVERLKSRADKADAFREKYNLITEDELRNAAIKFVLSHPNIHTSLIAIQNYDDLKTYASLSGQKLTKTESKSLLTYEAACGTLYCRHACNQCEISCPHRVPINTIMRYYHYFEAQGREKSAMVKYSSLTRQNSAICQDCKGYCQSACQYNVPIQGLLCLAHQTLTLKS